jgi:general secretion pathway protein D
MSFFNRLTAVILVGILFGPVIPLQARTKKGDKFLAAGRAAEAKKDWDAALEQYEKALSEDPADVFYQMAAQKCRFQTAQMHVDKGLKTRNQGQLGDALLEFQRAYAINPASSAAEQEIRRTQEMILRERKRAEDSGKASTPEEQALTPVQVAKKETQDKIGNMMPLPELKVLSGQPINLRLNNQKPKVLFDSVCKLAKINLLVDPEYQEGKNQSIEIDGSTLEEALDYIAVITKSYWKALSPNTIFVTNDNVTKRRDYEDQVMKVFYLSNVNSPQELQEIITAVRSVADIQRLFVYNSQNAIIARGEADRIALAEKIIADLDKPKSEVVVDILVMEASSVMSRKLTAAIASTGLNIPVSFSPRSGLRVVKDATTTGTTTGTGTDTSGLGTGLGTTTTTTASSTAIPISNLGRLASSDFSVLLPDALLQAVLSDAQTKVLQSPQLRSVDNQKATLKIGDRQPTATGSFGSGLGIAGAGINPLVNTQFTYIDVGVNVDLTPRVHDNGEVSMHIELEISSVNGHVNLGGIDQPIIGQRKVIHDIRMREGEINLLGGLSNQQDSRSKTGIPGVSKVPVLGRLFSGESIDRNRSELMIALIPHIVRRPEITPQNLKGIAVGNATVVKLNMAPRKTEETGKPAPVPTTPAPAAPKPAALVPAPVPAAAAPTPNAPVDLSRIIPLPTPGAAPPEMPPSPPPAPRAAAVPGQSAAPLVALTPGRLDLQLSGAATVSLTVANGQDVFAAPLQVQFDPKILRLSDITRGTLLSSDGQQVVFTKNIMNDAGTATVNLNRFPGTKGVSGSGTLVTLSFQAVGKGETRVTIPNLAIRDSQGAVVSTTNLELPVSVK